MEPCLLRPSYLGGFTPRNDGGQGTRRPTASLFGLDSRRVLWRMPQHAPRGR